MPVNRPGYSSDQFYFIDQIENEAVSGVPPMSRTTQDNPDFIYPGSYIPNVYDDLSRGPLGRLPVQRGFIRGIFPEIVKKIKSKNTNKRGEVAQAYKGIEAPVRRCFFQFNPSMILRSVQASSSTLNPLLQNPNQLLQAIPGQASFEFQILFNREAEVSGQKYKTGNGELRNTVPINQLLDNYGSTTDISNSSDASQNRRALPFRQDQVGDLGVLVDLYVLDSIIGQSITQDTIDSIRAYWQATKSLRATGELDANGKPINPYKDENFLDADGKFSKGLNNVLGNSAFLNPMPVRIVFSSLFMVEGFVTASNVAFHKFNENMVPTVCQVTLSVQALYIGFARKNSYITQQLEEQITTDINNSVADEAAAKTAEGLLRRHFFAKLANIGFPKVGFSDDSTGTEYVPSTITNFSLNSYFALIKSTNQGLSATNDDYRLRYVLAQRESSESLRFRTDPYFKELVTKKAALTDVNITGLKLYFYDVAELPSWAKTSNGQPNLAEIQLQSNKGKLDGGNYRGLSPVAKCNVKILTSDWLSLPSGGNRYTKDDLSAVDFKKLVDGTFSDPYELKWITDDFSAVMELDDSRSANSYFGDNVVILAQLTVEGVFSSAGGGDKTVRVIKSVARTFDPNKLFYPESQWLWGLDFDFLAIDNEGNNA